jgi:multimeric flavodoxin WrbA
LNHVLEGVEKQGAKNETIYLLGDTVLQCRACDACHITGRCPQKDEFNNIKDKILES